MNTEFEGKRCNGWLMLFLTICGLLAILLLIFGGMLAVNKGQSIAQAFVAQQSFYEREMSDLSQQQHKFQEMAHHLARQLEEAGHEENSQAGAREDLNNRIGQLAAQLAAAKDEQKRGMASSLEDLKRQLQHSDQRLQLLRSNMDSLKAQTANFHKLVNQMEETKSQRRQKMEAEMNEFSYALPANYGIISIILGILMIPATVLFAKGLFTLQPNEARVLVLFGKYVGTVRKDGFHWANPFAVLRGSLTTVPSENGKTVRVMRGKSRYVVSLRARNFNTAVLKVNDQRGNPIEIGAVVVWRVENTVQALFDVDDYEDYVRIQSESAVRHLAGSYPYDHTDTDDGTTLTLRGSSEQIGAALLEELQARLAKAGVIVDEARLTHLAYAPEIASAMLRRQQAEAVISARRKIVEGAVSMVEMALSELAAKKVVELDDERKAAMVGNLLVVLCGETEAEPVINAGTLYH